MGVPGRPDPPVLEKATHHSIELSWHHPPHPPEQGRLRYCVQEEDASRKDGFGTVYKYVAMLPPSQPLVTSPLSAVGMQQATCSLD